MGVSKKRGTPKSSILIGFSIINHPFWGTPILETPKWMEGHGCASNLLAAQKKSSKNHQPCGPKVGVDILSVPSLRRNMVILIDLSNSTSVQPLQRNRLYGKKKCPNSITLLLRFVEGVAGTPFYLGKSLLSQDLWNIFKNAFQSSPRQNVQVYEFLATRCVVFHPSEKIWDHVENYPGQEVVLGKRKQFIGFGGQNYKI